LLYDRSSITTGNHSTAERRRMPWQPAEKACGFEGPDGKLSLLDLFEGRRQLIVYRAFFEPGITGWPEHACVGCSFVTDKWPMSPVSTRATPRSRSLRGLHGDGARPVRRPLLQLPARAKAQSPTCRVPFLVEG
jgi:hypothetical protein